jgi:hypothetical protein
MNRGYIEGGVNGGKHSDGVNLIRPWEAGHTSGSERSRRGKDPTFPFVLLTSVSSAGGGSLSAIIWSVMKPVENCHPAGGRSRVYHT